MEKSPAYARKYNECLIKVKTYYASDPDFSLYLSEIARQEEEKKMQEKQEKRTEVWAMIGLGAMGIIAAVIGTILDSYMN